MSKKTYYGIASALHMIGYLTACLGAFGLIFVACCLDSEGTEAFYFLLRITAGGSLLVTIGALLLKISSAMRERRGGYASRPSHY